MNTSVDSLAREAVEVAVDAKVEAEIGPADYMLGRILLATGDVDAAIDELGARRARAAEQTLNPVLLAISLLERGDALARRGRLAEAVPAALAAADRLRAWWRHRAARPPRDRSRGRPAAPAGPARRRAGRRGADPRRSACPVIVAVGHLLAGAFDVEAMQLMSAASTSRRPGMLAASLLDGRVGAALATARADLAIGEGNVELAASAVDEGIEKVVHSGRRRIARAPQPVRLAHRGERELAALGRESDRARRRRDARSRPTKRTSRGARRAAARERAPGPGRGPRRVDRRARRGSTARATPRAGRALLELWTAAEWPRDAAYSVLRHAEALALRQGARRVVEGVFRVAEERVRGARESVSCSRPSRWLAQSAGVPAPVGSTRPCRSAPDATDDATEILAVLTPREREVLELVMAGATNRQIATRLFISDKTASVHVSRILTKLGVTSRAGTPVRPTCRDAGRPLSSSNCRDSTRPQP